MKGSCLSRIKYGEVVNNRRNGVDMDKVDYFMRDSICCFGKPALDVRVNRLVNSTLLVYSEGEWQLAFEEKLAISLPSSSLFVPSYTKMYISIT
ncbi:hypothetical protein ERJ75_000316200 [Trypanosoma vivax]|nr:hypothetical protein ERJ75_000316200 [Trypanosoma vivax]